MTKNTSFHKPYVFIHSALILAWLSNLAYTDSMFSIYVLCGIIGVFCVCSNYLRKPAVSRLNNFLLIVISVLFSVIVLLANYKLFSNFRDPLVLFDGGCTFLGGIILAYDVLVCIFDRLPYNVLSNDAPNRKSTWIQYLIFFGSIVAIDLIYLFFVEYPGILTNDSFTQVGQIRTGLYTNHHPYWHTMVIKLAYILGSLVSDNINACATIYSVIQVVLIAATFAYALITLYQINVPRRFIYMAWFIFALMPYNIAFSVCMNKDYLFSAAVLASVVSLYRILKQVGFKNSLNYFVFGISGLGICVLRSNGFIAFVLCIVFLSLFLWKNHKLVLSIMAGVAVLAWLMTNPFLSSLNITQPDLVESLSIPVQQVARVVYDGCELSEEETALIDRVADIDEIPALYTDWLSDPIKDEIRSKNNDYFEENIDVYLDLWIRLGLRYPAEYVKAWVDQTKGYWNGGYDYFIYALGVPTNDQGFTEVPNDNPIATIVNLIFKFCRGAIFMEPFESIGLHVWLVFILFAVNWMKRRQEMLLCVYPLAIVATLLIATPVYSALRYAYPVFTTYPFILAVSLCCKENEA